MEATIGEVSSEPGADERGAFTWYVIVVCGPADQWRVRSRWSQLDGLREALLSEGHAAPPLPLTRACGLPLLHPWRNSDAVVQSRRYSIRAFLDECVRLPPIARSFTLQRFLGIDAHRGDDAIGAAAGTASARPAAASRRSPIDSCVLRSEIDCVERTAEQMSEAHSSLRARITVAEEGSKRCVPGAGSGVVRWA